MECDGKQGGCTDCPACRGDISRGAPEWSALEWSVSGAFAAGAEPHWTHAHAEDAFNRWAAASPEADAAGLGVARDFLATVRDAARVDSEWLGARTTLLAPGGDWPSTMVGVAGPPDDDEEPDEQPSGDAGSGEGGTLRFTPPGGYTSSTIGGHCCPDKLVFPGYSPSTQGQWSVWRSPASPQVVEGAHWRLGMRFWTFAEFKPPSAGDPTCDCNCCLLLRLIKARASCSLLGMARWEVDTRGQWVEDCLLEKDGVTASAVGLIGQGKTKAQLEAEGWTAKHCPGAKARDIATADRRNVSTNTGCVREMTDDPSFTVMRPFLDTHSSMWKFDARLELWDRCRNEHLDTREFGIDWTSERAKGDRWALGFRGTPDANELPTYGSVREIDKEGRNVRFWSVAGEGPTASPRDTRGGGRYSQY